uniref:Uncharacterized protein n=1 Tax=Physcomitrium patens TaxID=3218 RepID=A0A2K1KA20_PHYPA|nr:hypothetical protein PHYPA_009795 [Physcomitrium patens]
MIFVILSKSNHIVTNISNLVPLCNNIFLYNVVQGKLWKKTYTLLSHYPYPL